MTPKPITFTRLQVPLPPSLLLHWQEVHALTYPDHRLTWPQWIRGIVNLYVDAVDPRNADKGV